MDQNISISERLEKEAWRLVERAHSGSDFIRITSKMAAKKEIQQRADELLKPLLIVFDQLRLVQQKEKKKLTKWIWVYTIYLLIQPLIPTKYISFNSYLLIVLGLALAVKVGLDSRQKQGILSLSEISEREEFLLNIFAEYRDYRIVAPMAGAMMRGSLAEKKLRDSNYNKYARVQESVLPLVKSEGDLQLTTYQVYGLISALRFNRPGLSIVILRAMPFVGNDAALGAVRRLAAQNIFDIDERIVVAAQECLPALEARVARSNFSEQLV